MVAEEVKTKDKCWEGEEGDMAEGQSVRTWRQDPGGPSLRPAESTPLSTLCLSYADTKAYPPLYLAILTEQGPCGHIKGNGVTVGWEWDEGIHSKIL